MRYKYLHSPKGKKKDVMSFAKNQSILKPVILSFSNHAQNAISTKTCSYFHS